MSKALRFPLETVEITIRNRIHYALTDRWGENWPRAAGFVAAAAPKTQQRVDAAYGEVGQNAITDRVVAELSFGFWPPLLRGRFVDELWKERIDTFFPHLPTDLDYEAKANLLAKLLGDARNLRNRISHLEPIFKNNLSLEHSNLGKLLSYACKDTAGWMRRHSTLNIVLRDGPSAMVSEPLPFKRAIKDAKVVAADQNLAELWSATMDGPRDFVIVTTEAGPRIIGNAEIGMWIRSKSADGIVDVENTLVGEVVAAIPPSPLVRRQVSVSELRSAVSRHRSRHVVVTETGEVGQAFLGVIDILDLIA